MKSINFVFGAAVGVILPFYVPMPCKVKLPSSFFSPLPGLSFFFFFKSSTLNDLSNCFYENSTIKV